MSENQEQASIDRMDHLCEHFKEMVEIIKTQQKAAPVVLPAVREMTSQAKLGAFQSLRRWAGLR
jgi:hypothetical protein